MLGASPFAASPLGAAGGAASAFIALIGRPSADLSAGGWLPSTGATLYSVINEAAVNHSDYIYTSTLSTCEVALNAMSGPGTTLSFWASSGMGNSLNVNLMQGGSSVASWSHLLTPVESLYSHTLTAAQSALLAGGSVSVQLTAA